jgi:hypothetical protein
MLVLILADAGAAWLLEYRGGAAAGGDLAADDGRLRLNQRLGCCASSAMNFASWPRPMA